MESVFDRLCHLSSSISPDFPSFSEDPLRSKSGQHLLLKKKKMDLKRYLVSIMGLMESQSENAVSMGLERESLCNMFD